MAFVFHPDEKKLSLRKKLQKAKFLVDSKKIKAYI